MKKKAAAGKGREALVVGSKVKGYIKAKNRKGATLTLGATPVRSR